MKKQKPKASILAVSLIIMGVMIVIALGISFSSLQSRKASIGSSKSNVAFQNADSGVEKVMYDITKGGKTTVNQLLDCNVSSHSIESPGKYKVELKDITENKINCDDSSKNISDIVTIKSTGYSSQDSRAIEVAVAQAAGVCSDYDSGWFAIDSLTAHEVSKAHGLGAPPRNVFTWACGAISGSTCLTRIITGEGMRSEPFTPRAIGPVSVTIDQNNIYLGISSVGNWAIWGYWIPPGGYVTTGDADGDARTGFYRIFACL